MATVPEEIPAPLSAGGAGPPRLRDPRRWVRRSDRLARVLITLGGVGIIVAVLLILVLIVTESLPLWRGAHGSREAALLFPSAASDPVMLAFADPYRETVVVLRSTGLFQQVDWKTRRLLAAIRVEGTEGWRITSARRIAGRDVMALGLEDGRVLLVEARVAVDFSPQGRRIDFHVAPLGEVAALPEGRAVRVCAAAVGETGTVLLASSGASDLVAVRLPTVDPEAGFPVAQQPAPPEPEDLSPALRGASVTALAIADAGDEAVVGTDSGEFLPIAIGEAGAALEAPIRLAEDPAPVTAAAFLFGGQSVAFGDAKGRVSSWFRVRMPENPSVRSYRKIHVFDPMPAAVTAIGVSTRNKGFVTADADGRAWLRHNTSEQTLLRFPEGHSPAVDAAIAPLGNGLFVTTAEGVVTAYSVDNRHPETTLRTLFGKVWYEGYEKPEYVWQSTGGTDDFEPKLSVTPLVFGTLKATIYALVFAVPISIAAALYAAIFTHPVVRRLIKPVVEIMAALPSVVIGFLAGLWLAPHVERTTVGTLLLLPVVALVVVLAAIGLRALPRSARARIRPLTEMAILVGLVGAGVFIAYRLGPGLEGLVFGGDFKAWLFESRGLRYDPRNSIVIGFAMGFAVIPIIFTISEDAFSNVPAHLSAASLALGASPWQTAMRVVVPTASPGVFSAVMIGFGRAVGETMIVLMATGNTPIMEWSLFNGMRTLSANIAVEIPEAPFGGTLYRVLFLAAAILFVMTFLVNTAAEIVRQRLRRKYEVL